MLNKLKEAPKKTVGTKQTLLAMDKDQVLAVFVADDAEQHVVSALKALALQKGVDVVCVPTMKELGVACEIQVGAASAAILKP